MADPETGEIIVGANQEIREEAARRILESSVEQVHVRSPLTCHAKRGICALCYGRSLATGQLVGKGVAVGIIAAQSIGEPGTQLTMRTFHTGGVAIGRGHHLGSPPCGGDLRGARARRAGRSSRRSTVSCRCVRSR